MMTRILMAALIVGGTTLGLAGCGETSKVEETKTATSPGGTTTESTETSVKTTGDNPPPASATEPVK